MYVCITFSQSHKNSNTKLEREREKRGFTVLSASTCHASRNPVPHARIFYRNMICVADEIVLMSPASSLTRPREKGRKREAPIVRNREKKIFRTFFTTCLWMLSVKTRTRHFDFISCSYKFKFYLTYISRLEFTFIR